MAAKILKHAEREVKAELSVGELAGRRDPVWAATVLVERFDESLPVTEPEVDHPIEELDDVLRRGLAAGAVSEADRALLLDLAYAANRLGAPLCRGRAGLSTPTVAELVSQDHNMSARTIRRHAADALDGLAAMPRGAPGVAVEFP